MMSSFFSLLPTDLQIHILDTWLNGPKWESSLLRVLVSLDIACSKVDQDAFRFLVSILPPFGEYNPRENIPRLTINYLQWLSSRKVPINSLMLAGNHTPADDAAPDNHES